MRSALLLSAMLLGGIATTTLLESEALACGGCFAPPENPTVVTDHRMILSVSKAQTTLYDQIRYQGDPGSFAWVLPIAGTVEVGVCGEGDGGHGAITAVADPPVKARGVQGRLDAP